jgi:hypothetical protein
MLITPEHPASPQPPLDTTEQIPQQIGGPIKTLCNKLEASGLLQNIEGPFLIPNSDSEALMIRLKGNRSALIMNDWESENFYHRQLKEFNLIFVIKDNDKVLVMQDSSEYINLTIQ